MSNKRPVMIELPDETYSECQAIGEKNGVSVNSICEEFVEFALQLYREGKMRERASEDSLFNQEDEFGLLG